MACPRCGDDCHCYAGLRAGAPPRLRFEIDVASSRQSSSAMLIDPEQYDATEEQFSASLESASSTPRFVPDQAALPVPSDEPATVCGRPEVKADPEKPPAAAVEERRVATTAEGSGIADAAGANETSPSRPPGQSFRSRVNNSDCDVEDVPDSWKDEVAARLTSYRARRKPRPPKYPSLRLDFESSNTPAPNLNARKTDPRAAALLDETQHPPAKSPAPPRLLPAEEPVHPSVIPSARIIEFPRFFTPPEALPDQLAEPVGERPRILDTPEVELPAPALGGIFLDAAKDSETDARPGFEVPLRSASVSRRVLAATVDAMVMALAGVLFAYIFWKLSNVIPPARQLLVAATTVAALLWAGYQYLLLTYSGTSPGLRVAKLRLTHFDGSVVPRSTRRWRVLASLLSGVSLGLGFAWCFLDEDALCWHDRITRTHLTPRD